MSKLNNFINNYWSNIKSSSRILFYFLSFNYLLSVILNYRYIVLATSIDTFFSGLYLHFALLSNTLMLYLIIFCALFATLLILPKKITLYAIALPFLILFHFSNFADTVIYSIFKYHFNPMVWNVIKIDVIENNFNSVHLGSSTWLGIIFAILFIVGIEILLMKLIVKRIKNDKLNYLNKGKRKLYLALILFLFILADKSLYAAADLKSNIEVLKYSKIFPLYQPLTIKSLVMKMGFKVFSNNEMEIKVSSGFLNYPKSPIQTVQATKKPNIIFILVDSFRSDMLNPDVSPNICEFAKRSIQFNNHYSGGNATRFGVYSIFYSLPGCYWHQFLSERQPPVFIDELIKQGYDFKIVSSTKLSFPEFRRTIFIKTQDFISDDYVGNSAAEKDPQSTDDLVNWIKNRNSDKPFFSFIFLDAPHGPYTFPSEFEKFKPSSQTINYLDLNAENCEIKKNSYKNSILFNDFLVNKIIKALDEKNMMDNSIVLISGDHGEEFNESGYYGHTSAFTKQQTKTPMVIHFPNEVPRVINNITSHLDVVPTIFDIWGYKNIYKEYSSGQSMLNGVPRKYAFVSGWDNCAIIDDTNFIVFGYETYKSTFEIRDSAYKFIPNSDAILAKKKNYIFDIIDDMKRFYK